MNLFCIICYVLCRPLWSLRRGVCANHSLQFSVAICASLRRWELLFSLMPRLHLVDDVMRVHRAFYAARTSGNTQTGSDVGGQLTLHFWDQLYLRWRRRLLCQMPSVDQQHQLLPDTLSKASCCWTVQLACCLQVRYAIVQVFIIIFHQLSAFNALYTFFALVNKWAIRSIVLGHHIL